MQPLAANVCLVLSLVQVSGSVKPLPKISEGSVVGQVDTVPVWADRNLDARSRDIVATVVEDERTVGPRHYISLCSSEGIVSLEN